MRRKTILALAAVWGIPDGWLIIGFVFIGFAVLMPGNYSRPDGN